MSMFESVHQFVTSDLFWYYHGLVLTCLWVVVATIGIILKRFNTTLHVLSFAIVDFTTLFFAGAAFYNIYPYISHFSEWPTIKKGHVIGGIVFVSLIILQHVGGVVAFLKNKSNPNHRAFGRPLATIGRIVATFGWILAGQMDIAKYVGASAAIILIGHLILSGKKESQSEEVRRERRRE